jgi:hypothetical protein
MTIDQIKTAELHIEMPDGSTWAVPVAAVAKNRAEHYKDEFGDDLERSLNEDTWPLFTKHRGEIAEWASNNMNWSDVAKEAHKVYEPESRSVDFQEGWMNGNKRVVPS